MHTQHLGKDKRGKKGRKGGQEKKKRKEGWFIWSQDVQHLIKGKD